MFLKNINDQTTYPYNPKTDYPNTSFPPGSDYPDFNIFWVHPSQPNPLAGQQSQESTPVFDGTKWIQSWEYVPISPSPDYEGLIAEIRDGTTYPLTQAWYDNLSPRKRDPLQSAIAVQDASLIQSRLIPILPTDEATLNEILALLTAFNIPISLQ